MIIRAVDQKKWSNYGLVVCAMIAMFSVLNVYNSALFGQYSANRTYVYYAIGAIIVAELLYLLVTSSGYLKINWFTKNISVFFLYILTLDLIRGISTWTILVHCGTLALWVCTFRFVEKTIIHKHETIKIYVLLVNGLFYLFAILSVVAQRDIADIRGQSVAVVNLSYYCLACLPITLVNGNKKQRFFNVAISIATSIYSLKRGAIVTVVLMLLAYYYIDGKVNKKILSTWGKISIAGTLIIIALLIVDYYTGGFLSARFTRTSLLDGSGRSQMISSAMENFSRRSFVERLLGTGSGTTSQTIGITLHNDYMEFIYCFGYIGLLIYIGIVISFFVRLIRYLKAKAKYAASFAMMIAFVLGLSVFEGALMNFAFLYVVIQTSTIDCMYFFDNRDNGVGDVS